ncbi:TetR/AcrR family transcriptional regulator [Maricaulis parjimensis]|uniref:TetR/AcrR family transcriptional regulator n=1 Tax=Maricaulis parjimensis TaxID=144023 RepID=UPI001939EE72|nr:TetR/AcrR family transcriptional regulator [Maricaulis parjimensis]
MTETLSLSPRARANREKIYQAAITLIERQGLEATTMDEIAAEAGMARASVFNHFPSKLLFLAEFFQRFTDDVIGAARSARLTGFRNRLEALFAAIGPIAHANKAMVREFASLAMGHGPLAEAESEADDVMHSFFRELVEEGQRTGELRPDVDTGVLTDFLLGILTVTTHDWVNSGQSSSLQADLAARFELLIQGIAKSSV